jgi:hypothetical protein
MLGRSSWRTGMNLALTSGDVDSVMRYTKSYAPGCAAWNAVTIAAGEADADARNMPSCAGPPGCSSVTA